MKLIIAGGRDFFDYRLLEDSVNRLYYTPAAHDCDSAKAYDGTYSFNEIVSGGAPGADKLGEQFAKKEQTPVKSFPANWDAHGKAAGPIRNGEMARYADELLAFWDTTVEGSGTYDMICQMTALNKPVHVVTYKLPKTGKAYPKK